MSKFGLIGNPISHSKSPALFRAAYGDSYHSYSLFEAESVEEALSIFINGDIKGVNVTSPFKDSVMDYVTLPDRISSILKSANVLIKGEMEGEILSYNTDYFGVQNTIKEALAKEELLPEGLRGRSCYRVAVVGAGGAGKAAALAMCDLGHEVSIINRSAGRVADFAKEIGANYVPLSEMVAVLSEADIIIYSLSFPLPGLEFVDSSEKIIFEANYAKASLSPEMGFRSGLYIDGRYWLYHQAIPAFILFTEMEPNALEMRKVMGIE